MGTAAAEGRINVSPKGMDSLRVLAKETLAEEAAKQLLLHLQLRVYEDITKYMKVYYSAILRLLN